MSANLRESRVLAEELRACLPIVDLNGNTYHIATASSDGKLCFVFRTPSGFERVASSTVAGVLGMLLIASMRLGYDVEFVAGAGRDPSVSVDGHKVPGNGAVEFARAYGLATQARASRRVKS